MPLITSPITYFITNTYQGKERQLVYGLDHPTMADIFEHAEWMYDNGCKDWMIVDEWQET